MPQKPYNAPDMIDVENICASIGESYSCVVYFSTRIRGGKVELIGKTHSAPYSPDAPVQHVALASWPVQLRKDMAQEMFNIAWDLWCQHDGAGATAAKRGAPRSWQGGIETPRRRG